MPWCTGMRSRRKLMNCSVRLKPKGEREWRMEEDRRLHHSPPALRLSPFAVQDDRGSPAGSYPYVRCGVVPIKNQAADPAATAPPSAASTCAIQDAVPTLLASGS